MKPKCYLNFVLAVLKDEQAAAQLLPEDQRGIFGVLITQSKLPTYEATQLKRRYLTPEEQQAELEAKKAAEAEKKRQEHLKMVQEIESCYAETNNGTFESVAKYLDKYRYYDDKEAAARRVVCDGLDELLQNNGYALSFKEADLFVGICRDLIQGGILGWTEFQSYISRIKEVKYNDPDGDSCQ